MREGRGETPSALSHFPSVLFEANLSALTTLTLARSPEPTPTAPSRGELRGGKGGVEPAGNNEMRIQTQYLCHKHAFYARQCYAHLVSLLLSAPSQAPPNLPRLRHLERCRINQFEPGKACGVDLVKRVLTPMTRLVSRLCSGVRMLANGIWPLQPRRRRSSISIVKG